MVTFKGVMVSKKSELAAALESGDRKGAEKVFSETTQRYKARYSEEDRKWFEQTSRRFDQVGNAPA